MDFTLKTYHQLLDALIAQGYTFQTFAGFLENPAPRAIILRHDVDARPGNSLRFAQIQHTLRIKGSYYFRIVPQSYNEAIIKEIASLGHEIGYHYETMDLVSSKFKVQSSKFSEIELIDAAMELFLEHLEKFRKIAPIKTVCMHGSPLSSYDNRDLWKRYNYKDFGIIGEPYFDVDFTKVLYLTDTGRRWDGVGSIRDRVQSSKFKVQSEVESVLVKSGNSELNFRRTADIISAANAGLLPDQIMFTFHPQRWTNRPGPWLKELVLQNVKNVAKRWLVGRRA
jgi:hypothetical protein